MKQILAVAVCLQLFVAPTGASDALAAPARSAVAGHCAQNNGYQSCNGNDDVTVTGGSSSKHGNDRVEAGGIQTIACGPGAANDLSAAGDRNATVDALSCTTGEIACAAARQDRQHKQIAVVRIEKRGDGTWGYANTGCAIVGPAQVTAAMVRARVVRLVPSAALGLAPHDATLVNIQTIMWVNAPDHQTLAPITILGRRVLVTLNLDHVDWGFGDHHSDRTSSAGKAYDGDNDPCRAAQCPDYYGHTYRDTGAMTVTATASWTASFTVDGGRAVPIPGTVGGPTAQAAVRVKQARAVLVPSPGDH